MHKDSEQPKCADCPNRGDSVFCNTSSENLEELEASKVCSNYKKGEIIFKEGGFASGIHCIQSGKIKLSMLGDEGREQIVRLVKSGDVIGYKALLSGDKYSATAVALEDVQTCFIPKEYFVKVLKKDTGLSFEMMKLLSNELRHAEEKITLLAQKPVRERMAETILFLNETYGIDKEDNINVQLSREEIANIVGTATETAIRLLSEFNKDNLIELSGKKIKITNKPKLIKLANLYD